MYRRSIIALVAWSAVFVGVVQAEEKIYSGSIPLSSTNWSNSITIPKFSPSLGTLTSIEFQLSGHVEGTARFEHMGNGPATVTMDLKANIELQRPDSTLLVLAIPLAQTVDTVTIYDQALDFGGESGRTYNNLSGNITESRVSPPPLSDLTLFTGYGDITLPVVASGTSQTSGSGNITYLFTTSASADAQVKYIYDVPEPATFALLALGGLACVKRKRR